MAEPVMSRGEERANSLSHAVGFLGAVAATPILIVRAVHDGSAANIVASSIFGATMMMLYLASALYHAALPGPRKEWLERFDHAAIYLLIAGSYTPFTLGVLRGPWGWSLFGVVWAAAVVGVVIKLSTGVRYRKLSTAMYLLMGWAIVIAIRPLVHNMQSGGLAWLAGGGLAYTLGTVFYLNRRLRYAHFLWHLFVLAGSTCHFFAVLWFAI